MMLVFLFVFILSIFALLHTYLFFPWHMRQIRKSQKWPGQEHDEPFVTIVLSVYNEQELIEEKIRTSFSTSYNQERFEVLVGSDASNDGTNSILLKLSKEFPNLNINLFEQRRGKPEVVNDLVSFAKGEILILTDADTFFNKDTIPELVAPFADNNIGGVQAVIESSDDGHLEVYKQEQNYNKGEFEIKQGESSRFAVIGAHGACYAIRKALFTPVPSGYSVDDFYIFMKVLEQRQQTVLAQHARCSMVLSGDAALQFRRKVRMASGNYKNLFAFRKMIHPKYGFIAYAFISHKVLRWKGPFFLAATFIANILLIPLGKFFELTLWGQIIFYLIGLLDLLIGRQHVNFYLPRLISHFCMMNLAFVLGLFRAIFSKGESIWQNR